MKCYITSLDQGQTQCQPDITGITQKPNHANWQMFLSLAALIRSETGIELTNLSIYQDFELHFINIKYI